MKKTKPEKVNKSNEQALIDTTLQIDESRMTTVGNLYKFLKLNPSPFQGTDRHE